MNPTQLVSNPKKYYYLVYQTTNLVNGMIYVGVHATKNINDNYLGSGKYLCDAIKQFGVDNFKRDILFLCSSKEEMLEKEKQIVSNEFRNRQDTYNKNIGGGGRFNALGLEVPLETRKKLSEFQKGKPKPRWKLERREKMKESMKDKIWIHKREGELLTSTMIKKHLIQTYIVDMGWLIGRGRLQSNEEKLKRANSNRGKKRSKEYCVYRREKMTGNNNIARTHPKSKESYRKIVKTRRNNSSNWHSEETKKKIVETRRRNGSYIVTQESKDKMSKAHKGKPGHPHTQESKKKIGEANKKHKGKFQWLTFDNKNYQIKTELVQKYLLLGYVKGRLNFNPHK